MLGKKRPPRPSSGKSGLARKPEAPKRRADDALLTIERLAHDGRGIAHDAAGKTVFVEKALTGERVEVAVHTTRKRFDEAHVKRRLSDADSRATPPCPYFERCGGCDLQHMTVAAQRAHKQTVVRELMARQGVALGDIELIAGAPAHYRRRARLGVKLDAGGNVLLGFRAQGSHHLIDIAQCHVLVPELSALLAPLKALLSRLEAPRLVGHLELIKPEGAPVVLVRQLKAHAGDAEAWRAFAKEQGVRVGAFVGREERTLEWYVAPPVLEDPLDIAHVSVRLGFAPGDFLQVNAEVNQRMVERVLGWLAPTLAATPAPKVMDLFAGIGNFSVPLALKGAHVQAVEGSPAMVARMADNAERNGVSLDARQADLSDAARVAALFEGQDEPHCVVLDPPRDGAEAVCRALGERPVKQVAYISCDPATLARDAALLVNAGYRVRRAAVADMFVHTAHVETLLLFEHAG